MSIYHLQEVLKIAELKTLKDMGTKAMRIESLYQMHYVTGEELKQEAINDLINIYELEKILNIKLNDKIVGILSKYIMWKNNIEIKDVDKDKYFVEWFNGEEPPKLKRAEFFDKEDAMRQRKHIKKLAKGGTSRCPKFLRDNIK